MTCRVSEIFCVSHETSLTKGRGYVDYFYSVMAAMLDKWLIDSSCLTIGQNISASDIWVGLRLIRSVLYICVPICKSTPALVQSVGYE